MKKRSRTWIALCSVALILLICLVGWRLTAPIQIFAPAKNIRFDDFDFTAVSAKETKPGEYDVVVRVTNSAKRVDFKFDPEVVRVYGPSGSDLNIDQRPDGADIRVGESVERTFHVSGTPLLAEMFVRFDFGGGIGTVLDTLIYGRRSVRLEVGH